jgi:predicted CXXCH cytochrome family protein
MNSDEIYPHIADWKASHLKFIAVREGDTRIAQFEVCLSCHSQRAQAQALGPSLECGSSCHASSSASQNLKPTQKVSNTCSGCHTFSTSYAFDHAPASTGQCDLCHSSHSTENINSSSKFPDSFSSPDDSCFRCHSRIQTKSSVHSPFQDGKCGGCHDLHGASFQKLLKAETPQLCYNCHPVFLGSSVHGVMNYQNGCLLCHGPHSGSKEKMLELTGKELCLSCHNSEIPSRLGRTLVNIAQRARAANPHSPVNSENCTETCHGVHATSVDRLLKAAYATNGATSGNVSTYSLCFQCHEENMLQGVHMKTTNFRRDVDGGDVIIWNNLHYSHVTGRGVSCSGCHDPHGSSYPFNLRNVELSGTIATYSKTSEGGSCTNSCHPSGKTYQRLEY